MEQTSPVMEPNTTGEEETQSDDEHGEGEDTFDEEPKKPMILKKNSKFSEELVSGLLKNLNQGVSYKLDPKTESELINVMNKKVSSEVNGTEKLGIESQTADFENQPDNAYVMSSSTKNRVQVPKNRRPPSRIFSQDDLLKVMAENGMDKDEVNFEDLLGDGIESSEVNEDGFNELFTNMEENNDMKVEEEINIDNDFNSLLIENEICEDTSQNTDLTGLDPFESLIQESLDSAKGSPLPNAELDSTREEDLLDLSGIQSNEVSQIIEDATSEGEKMLNDNMLLDIENEEPMPRKASEETGVIETETKDNENDIPQPKSIDEIFAEVNESKPDNVAGGFSNIFSSENIPSGNPKDQENTVPKEKILPEKSGKSLLIESVENPSSEDEKKRHDDEIKALKMQLNSVRISSANEITSLEKDIERLQEQFSKQAKSLNDLQTKYDESLRINNELQNKLEATRNGAADETIANENSEVDEFSNKARDDLLLQVLQLNEKVVSQDTLIAELKEDNIVLRSQTKSLLESGNMKRSKIKNTFSSLGGGDSDNLLSDSFVWEDPSDIRKRLLELEVELEDQKEVNSQLKSYVGDVLVNIMLKNPQILEKRQ